MKLRTSSHAQSGATLIMGLILLALLMLSVVVSFQMSTNNLKSVGNMQFRTEVAAATDAAVEKLISTDAIFLAPALTAVPTDSHGVTVSIAAPVCIKSVEVDANISADTTPNIYQEGVTPAAASGYLETHWDIAATGSSGVTGAKVESHQGIKVILPADPNPCP